MEYKSKEELLRLASFYDGASVILKKDESATRIDLNVKDLVDQAYESGKQEGLKEKQSDPFMGFKVGDKVHRRGHSSSDCFKIINLYISSGEIYPEGTLLSSCEYFWNGLQNILTIPISELEKVPDSPKMDKPDSARDLYDHVQEFEKKVKVEIANINDRLYKLDRNLP